MSARETLRLIEALYRPSGPMRTAPILLDPEYRTKYVEVFDDFVGEHYVASGVISGNLWTPMNDGSSGTNAHQALTSGVIGLVTAASDNDYQALRTTGTCFLPADGKPIWFASRFKLAEATTNDSAWWFGLSNTVTTGGLQAHASGPLASYDGILLWKDEDTLTIDFETSITTTQNTINGIATFASDTWTRVGFHCDGTGLVTPYVDVGDGAGWKEYSAQRLTLSGLNPMYLIFGVKAGPGGAAETLQVDYVHCIQER